MMSTDVWVMEDGDYEDRTIYGVFSSPATAQEYLERTFDIVEWEPVRDLGDERLMITGHFESTRGFSTKHTAHFELTRYTIDAKENA